MALQFWDGAVAIMLLSFAASALPVKGFSRNSRPE